jgi:ABC-2 type transport system ATP-binding protein
VSAFDQDGSGLPSESGSGPEVLIDARGLGKRFARFHRRATSLKERAIRRDQGPQAEFWALRDVDLIVRRGETVGLVGPNGSGKSTLLKCLAGILRPTSGSVQINGRVASLLELGAGFDGELTGRENIYLNSALLGVPRGETDRLLDEIIEFSELRDRIDDPVKHYSSGQYMRLGFAVAVHVDPDILIVDEVLAVGDAAFQNKCMERIRLFQRQGKTILFVSHSAGQVVQLCTRAVLLSAGRVLADGPPQRTIAELEEMLGVDHVDRRTSGGARIAAVALVDPETAEPLLDLSLGSSAVLMADVQWVDPDQLRGPVHAELVMLNGADVDVVIEPDRFQIMPGDAGARTSLRWFIPLLPATAGAMTMRLTVSCDGEPVARADLPGIVVRGGSTRRVDGSATSFEVDPTTQPTPAP